MLCAFIHLRVCVCVCALNPLIAQGEISFEDFVAVSGNTYSAVVNYTNDANTTYPTSIDLRIEVSGGATSVSAQQAPGGWAASYNSTTKIARFNGSVIPPPMPPQIPVWNSAPGATNKIGTISFDIANSGCVSLESTIASLLIDLNHPLVGLVPPVENSDFACKVAGEITLAAGTSSLRPRLVELSAPGALSTTTVTMGNDFTFLMNQINYSGGIPTASLNVFPDSYDEYNSNLNLSDLNLIQDYILGRISLVPFQLVASDANKDSYVDIFDIIGIQKVILGTNVPSDMPQPWAYPTTPSLPSVTDPVSYVESYDFSDINTLTSLDFTAIKLGDVSIDDLDYDKSTGDTRFFHLEDVGISTGEIVNVPVFVDDLDKMDLLSMSLGFQQDKVEIVGVDAAALPVQVNDNYVINRSEGTFNLIWSELAAPGQSSGETPAFYLKISAIQEVPSLAEVLYLTEDRVTNTAFWTNHQKSKGGKVVPVNLSLRWEELTSVDHLADFVVLTSENPISDEIRLTISSEVAQMANLQLFDVSGRQVFSNVASLAVGDTPVSIRPLINNLTKGVYVLLVSDDSGRRYSTKIVKWAFFSNLKPHTTEFSCVGLAIVVVCEIEYFFFY